MKFFQLKGKDLVVIAVFTVIMFVIDMAVGMTSMMVFGIHIAMLFAGLPVLFIMPVYMLMAAKVKKPGVLLVNALLYGLVSSVMSTFYMLLIIIIPAIIGELIVSLPRKNSSLGYNVIAYTFYRAVYSLHGTFIVLLLGRENFREKGAAWFGEEQMSRILDSGFEIKYVAATFGITVLCGIIGYFAGKSLLRRNFEKAGVI